MRTPEHIHARKGCMPKALGIFLSASAFAAAIYGTGQYYAAEAAEAPQVDAIALDSQECEVGSITHREADLALEGTYFLPGELDSYPSHQEGLAHSYGWGEELNEFTSSGEAFDPNAMAAASWFYPLGSQVRVTDMLDGDSLVVRINDRGPNRITRPDVIIDLTSGAIQELEPGADRLVVSVEPICQP